MKLWGLTGGIASGKSTVSRMLIERGAHLLDADQVYHRLLLPIGRQPSPLTEQINAAFPGMLQADGRLDRAKLGAQVFASPAARGVLESLTHPAVGLAVQAQLQLWRDEGVTHAIYDVPLLFEKGLEDVMDGVIVVWVPAATQVERLMQRDALSAAAAQMRLDAQLPIESKRRRARWVIDNTGSMAQTEAQVVKLWQDLAGIS